MADLGGAPLNAPTTAARVSIIVPTLDEAQNLPRLLGSIAAQRGVVAEVVVVDQTSNDGTADLAAGAGAKVVSLPRPMFYSPPGRRRNVGASASTGEFLLHLDADMELPDGEFLMRLVRLLDDEHGAVAVHERDVALGFWNRCKALERSMYQGTSVEAARACRRDLFDRVGGYDEDINSGEDFFLSARLAAITSIASAPDLFVLHHTGSTPLRRLVRKKFSYGRTADLYFAKAAPLGSDSRLLLLRRWLGAYARGVPRAVTQPHLLGGMFVLRGLEIAALQAGATLERVRRRLVASPTRGGPVVKAAVSVVTLSNWPLLLLDKAGLVRTATYRTRRSWRVRCRARTADVNELVVIASGIEYPADLLRLDDGAVVIDGGANIGAFALYLHDVNRGVDYTGHAVEPFPSNLELLRHNLDSNGVERFTVHGRALVGDGSSSVFLDPSLGVDAVTVTTSPAGSASNAVPATSLEEFCREHGIERVDLLKLDIEGSEHDLLASDWDFVVEHVDRLILEFHYVDEERNGESIRALVESAFDVDVLRPSPLTGVLAATNRRKRAAPDRHG